MDLQIFTNFKLQPVFVYYLYQLRQIPNNKPLTI
ncbi:hypothetical protein AQBE111736_07905 [Aquirufa beregesia]